MDEGESIGDTVPCAAGLTHQHLALKYPWAPDPCLVLAFPQGDQTSTYWGGAGTQDRSRACHLPSSCPASSSEPCPALHLPAPPVWRTSGCQAPALLVPSPLGPAVQTDGQLLPAGPSAQLLASCCSHCSCMGPVLSPTLCPLPPALWVGPWHRLSGKRFCSCKCTYSGGCPCLAAFANKPLFLNALLSSSLASSASAAAPPPRCHHFRGSLSPVTRSRAMV